MDILVDNNLQIVGYGYLPTTNPNCLTYQINDTEESKFSISGYKYLNLNTMSIDVVPHISPTITPYDANKQAVMQALQNNVGQVVTAQTVNSLLQYLGSLP